MLPINDKEKQSKEVITSDGFKLSTNVFTKNGDPKLNILIAPATGVHQKFYTDLAIYLSELGYKVITFDFRGIGESKYTHSKNSKASFTKWALIDFKTVFEDSLNERRTAVVGHSFGALSYTVQERANEALGLYGFGTGSGHHSFMPKLEGLRVLLFWKLITPITVLLKGYMPDSISQMGSDIPKDVYREWKKWCSMKSFWLEDKNAPSFLKKAQDLSTKIRIVTATDDPWTSIESAKSYYDKINQRGITQYKNTNALTKKVGHTGYFKLENKDLFWIDLRDWLKGL